MSWHTQRLMAFDTETTGVDIETDRIVTAAAILLGGGDTRESRTWMSDADGIEIPEGATKVHGITTEHARTHGQPAKGVIEDVVTVLGEAAAAGTVLVGHNIVYDLSILDREARRHLGCGLHEAIPQAQLTVIDTMVLDRRVAPFRRRVSETQGPYQMRTTAETYGLGWDEEAAHGAEYDALMSARAAWHMGNIAHLPPGERPRWVRQLRTQRFDSLRGVTAQQLHQAQIGWAAADASSYQAWLRNRAKAGAKYDAAAVIDGTWPLRPFEGVSA